VLFKIFCHYEFFNLVIGHEIFFKKGSYFIADFVNYLCAAAFSPISYQGVLVHAELKRTEKIS
jgi:hypothetical protein